MVQEGASDAEANATTRDYLKIRNFFAFNFPYLFLCRQNQRVGGVLFPLFLMSKDCFVLVSNFKYYGIPFFVFGF